jgi:hypothetical protein
MSSYGNHVWTPNREAIAERLVTAAIDLDDDAFRETIDGIETCTEIRAVAALAIENLAGKLDEAEIGADDEVQRLIDSLAGAPGPLAPWMWAACTPEVKQTLTDMGVAPRK